MNALALLAEVTRGAHVESLHLGAVAVVNARGLPTGEIRACVKVAQA